jgi:hypothetical protein
MPIRTIIMKSASPTGGAFAAVVTLVVLTMAAASFFTTTEPPKSLPGIASGITSTTSGSQQATALTGTTYGTTTFGTQGGNSTTNRTTQTASTYEYGYFPVFETETPSEGVLQATYIYPNFTSSVNVAQEISLTSLSGQTNATQGIVIGVSPEVISSRPGYQTVINLTVTFGKGVLNGTYLISYPLEVCPGILIVVGTPPRTLPLVTSNELSTGACLDPQTVPAAQQVRVMAGFNETYLPEAPDQTI